MLNYQQGSDKYKVAVRQLFLWKKYEFGDDLSISALKDKHWPCRPYASPIRGCRPYVVMLFSNYLSIKPYRNGLRWYILIIYIIRKLNYWCKIDNEEFIWKKVVLDKTNYLSFINNRYNRSLTKIESEKLFLSNPDLFDIITIKIRVYTDGYSLWGGYVSRFSVSQFCSFRQGGWSERNFLYFKLIFPVYM